MEDQEKVPQGHYLPAQVELRFAQEQKAKEEDPKKEQARRHCPHLSKGE